MTPEERFAWVRQRQCRYLSRRSLTAGTRGAMTGRITKGVRSAADMLHLPVSNARDIRLDLASVIFGRSLLTYNELQDAELWALDQWIGKLRDVAMTELKDWLQSHYGSQPQLL